MIPQNIKDRISDMASVRYKKGGKPHFAYHAAMINGAMIALESQWIRVEDGLPDWDTDVLVYGLRIQRSPLMGGNKPVTIITRRRDLTGTALAQQRLSHTDENGFYYMEKTMFWQPLPQTPTTP